jgi:hypothetical protein
MVSLSLALFEFNLTIQAQESVSGYVPDLCVDADLIINESRLPKAAHPIMNSDKLWKVFEIITATISVVGFPFNWVMEEIASAAKSVGVIHLSQIRDQLVLEDHSAKRHSYRKKVYITAA